MTVLEILDASFRLYRENFLLFLGIVAVVWVPLTALVVGSLRMLYAAVPQAVPRPGRLPALNLFLSSPQGEDIPDLGGLVLSCSVVLLVLLLQVIAVPIANGALARAVSDRYMNASITLGTAYRNVLAMFWSYLATTFLSGLVIALATVASVCLLCTGGLLMLSIFAFVAQIMVLEGTTGIDAMRRSAALTRDHRWRVAGLFLLTLLVGFILNVGLQQTFALFVVHLVESPTTRVLLEQGTTQVAQMLVQPLWGVAWGLMYYDLRIRKEGLDLHILADAEGTPAVPA